MKKLLILLLAVTAIFTITATADDLLIMPAPNKESAPLSEEEAKKQALIDSLVKGIVPITPELTYEEFLSYLNIIDESDGKHLTAKFETFVRYIQYYHYSGRTVEEIFELFKEKIDSVDINDMDTAYKALLSAMDRFSYYLTPDEAADFFNPTSSKGIGIMMIWKDAEGNLPAGVYVEEVAVGSTAEAAGILPGDRILEFNGQDVRGLGFDALTVYSQAVESDAQTLSVTMARGDEIKEYTLERASNLFKEYSFTEYPEKNLIYLDINSFMYESTAQEIGSRIDRAWADGYRNIIIDLQGNSGGDVYVASEILSKFTPKKEILFYMGRNGNYTAYPFASKGNGYSFNKISILVDSATASSSEIFSLTLRNIAGAELIGAQTFGKGVAQSLFSFTDNAAIGITTYVAYDSNGKTYNEIGLIPDSRMIPKINKYTLPKGTPSYTALNYTNAVQGAENATVKGLEIRLEAIGFLASDEIDNKWGDATTRAIKAFQLYSGIDVTGKVDLTTYTALIAEVNKWQSTYYYVYTPFDYAFRFFEYVK